MSWRVGSKVPLNVYEDDRPMFQCRTPGDARRIVSLLNCTQELAEALNQGGALIKLLNITGGMEWNHPDGSSATLKGVPELTVIRDILAKFHQQEGK